MHTLLGKCSTVHLMYLREFTGGQAANEESGLHNYLRLKCFALFATFFLAYMYALYFIALFLIGSIRVSLSQRRGNLTFFSIKG